MKDFIGFRLESDLIKRLDVMAKSENRTRSGMIFHIIKEYLKQVQDQKEVKR
jgi:predicted transcriptional regulator